MTQLRGIPATAAALLALLAVPAGSAHAAEPPWVGSWAASTLWCRPGAVGGAAPTHVTPKGHQSGSNECVYTDIQRDGERHWRIDAECVGSNGIPYHERFSFTMVGDNLEIGYPDRGGVQVLQMRCP